MRLLHRAGVRINPNKCEFFVENNDYLGHIIRPGTFELAEHTTVTAAKRAHLTTKTEPRSFLALRTVFMCYFPSFGSLVTPSHKEEWKNHSKPFGPPK